MTEFLSNIGETSSEPLSPELLSALRQEETILAQFVHAHLLPLHRIETIPLTGLRELTDRFAFDTSGKLRYRAKHLSPRIIKAKFETLAGITPVEQQRHLDPSDLTDATQRAVEIYEQDRLTRPNMKKLGGSYPRARVLGVICNGSFVQPWKTPNVNSDVDCCTVFTDEGYHDDSFGTLLKDQLGIPVDYTSISYGKMQTLMSDLMRREAHIAPPYRQLPPEAPATISAHSYLAATSPELTILQQSLRLLPPNNSDLPFLNRQNRPSHKYLSRERGITPASIAWDVEQMLP